MSHINVTLIVATAILFLINRPQLSKLNYSSASCVMPRGTVFQDEKPTSRKRKKVVPASCSGPFQQVFDPWMTFLGETCWTLKKPRNDCKAALTRTSFVVILLVLTFLNFWVDKVFQFPSIFYLYSEVPWCRITS